MRRENAIEVLAGVVICLVATANGAHAAASGPTLTMGLQLLDTSNQPLPQSGPNTYVLQQNQVFRVLVSNTLANPEVTDSFHVDQNGNP